MNKNADRKMIVDNMHNYITPPRIYSGNVSRKEVNLEIQSLCTA
jgi:hypothetical protein